jgi:hypothetical protein
MDSGQTAFIISQLSLGAVTTFLAIMLWSRTRDAAWMLIIIGVIILYIEIIYSILGLFGMSGGEFFLVGSVPIITFILPVLRMIFFIAGLLIMVIRQFRNK